MEIDGESNYVKQVFLHEKFDNTFPPGTPKDESFDIQAIESNAWRARPYNRTIQIQGWTLYFLMGVSVGVIAFVMNNIEELLFEANIEWTQDITDKDGLGLGWLVYTVFSVVCVAAGTALSLYYGPGAIGSGVAETMGVVNGYNYHGFIGVNTLITKALGVVFAVAGGMRVGKEGPLAHIGSLVGCGMIYLPFKFNEAFRNDRDKRNIIAAGAGVGVAVAFGAPIGGVLFAYEVSKANSFWTFQLAWKTFLATAMSNFTLAVCRAL